MSQRLRDNLYELQESPLNAESQCMGAMFTAGTAVRGELWLGGVAKRFEAAADSRGGK
jgi:hypothetical protein